MPICTRNFLAIRAYAAAFIVAAGLLTASPGAYPAPDALVDIKAIALKAPKEVERVIGKAKACRKSKYGQHCEYKAHQIEITYINGKADWISINDLGNIRFSANALHWIGLADTQPSFENENVIRWNQVGGILEVSIFPSNGDLASNFYIKSATE